MGADAPKGLVISKGLQPCSNLALSTLLVARLFLSTPRLFSNCFAFGSSWHSRNLDEIYAGLFDGMTYEEIELHYPEEGRARTADKFQYRYPRGESYTDLIARLEPLAHEIERLREPLVIIAHQAILRVLYSYFLGLPREECIGVSIPLNTVIQITPTANGCEETRTIVLPHTAGEQLDPASH